MGDSEQPDYVFHRTSGATYPIASHASGIYIHDSAGNVYMDATSSTFCSLIGHGVGAVRDAILKQFDSIDYANTSLFSSDAARRFAARLLDLAPRHYGKVYFSTSGSLANESALKLARQYHMLCGEAEKTVVIARWNAYHGGTIAALSMTGHPPRRQAFEPYLLNFPHIEPPYCYRCPWGKRPETCGLECAGALDSEIKRIGSRYVAAFIVEPVSGGPLGAATPPREYLNEIKAICERHRVLLIVDEVVTGAGRTGRPLAIDHSGVIPDIITLGKGIAGGYAPVGAILIHDHICARFEQEKAAFKHQESFSGHPLVCAIGDAVLEFVSSHGLIDKADELGTILKDELEKECDCGIVGDIRGRGLLQGLELVKDRSSKQPFPTGAKVAEKIARACAERGLLVLPSSGCVDGVDGDTLTIAPPLTITADEIGKLASILGEVLSEFSARMGADAKNESL